MKRLLMTTHVLALLLTAVIVAQAQETKTAVANRETKISVGGDAVVKVQPDTAILNVAVVTQGRQALDAQQENATKTESVIRALKAAAGPGAEIKTSGYSLQPQRVYRENQPPTISGYEARNMVTVTMTDLPKLGNLIDAAAQAGANDIAGISFTLRQDRAARDQALQAATQEALSKAKVIAQALGGRVVRVAEVQEEGFQRPPQPRFDAYMATREASTPVEIGALEITARVQLIAIVEMSPL